MPYSKFHQMAKGKLESTQQKLTNCSADLAFVSDKEFAELVWENGQILMQGQSNRTRKSPPCTGFTSHTSKDRGKDEGDTHTAKIEKFGNSDLILNDFSTSGPSGHMGLGQEDELIHLLNYPIDDYCSEFFSELSGVNMNVQSMQNNSVMIDKNTSNNSHIVRDSHMVPVYAGGNPEQGNASKVFREGHEPSIHRSSQLCSPSLQQCQTSLPFHRSRGSDFMPSNTNYAHKAPCGNPTQNLTSIGRPMNTTMQKQNTVPSKPPLQPSNNTSFMNFSHFLRPSAPVKSNLQSIGGATAGPDSSNMDTFRSSDKLSIVGSSYPVESTVIESTSGLRSITGIQNQPVSKPAKVDENPSMGKSPKEPLYAKPPEAMCREDAFRKNISPDQVLGQASSFAASVTIERPDDGKNAELVVASSVCSANSARGTSNDPKHALKRKSQDTEESEYPSEDVEEESVARKSATARGGMGTKRSRAAEVHNLSERRRRDRINEKMRALQELIPNCNKVDKASMLDEAIEYLKTLQLQVQIMSMGTGFCVPQMMLPTGMQQIHAPHMAHFSPMGMGMGCGMGMLDLSGGSSSCPLIQVPPMHGAQFPCTPISGPSSLPMMTGPGLQMFGFPGQGFPMSVPHAPFVHLSGGPSEKSLSLPVSVAATPLEVPGPALPSSSKDPTEDVNSQMMPKTSAECSQNQTSIQCQATKEDSERSAMVQRKNQTPHVSGD